MTLRFILRPMPEYGITVPLISRIEKGAVIQAGSMELVLCTRHPIHIDASILLLPLVDFLPATDPRMKSTIKTIERELSENGQVYRWKG